MYLFIKNNKEKLEKLEISIQTIEQFCLKQQMILLLVGYLLKDAKFMELWAKRHRVTIRNGKY